MPTTQNLGMNHVFPHTEMELLHSCAKFARFAALQDCLSQQYQSRMYCNAINLSGLVIPLKRQAQVHQVL